MYDVILNWYIRSIKIQLFEWMFEPTIKEYSDHHTESIWWIEHHQYFLLNDSVVQYLVDKPNFEVFGNHGSSTDSYSYKT